MATGTTDRCRRPRTRELLHSRGPRPPWWEVGNPRVDGYERVSGSAVLPIGPQPSRHVVRSNPPLSPCARHGPLGGCIRSEQATGSPRGTDRLERRGRRPSPGHTAEPPDHCSTPSAGTKEKPLAAVAAETPQQAADALRAIVVDYEVLPHVTDETRGPGRRVLRRFTPAATGLPSHRSPNEAMSPTASRPPMWCSSKATQPPVSSTLRWSGTAASPGGRATG